VLIKRKRKGEREREREKRKIDGGMEGRHKRRFYSS
jgi:hypothetical protein